MDVNCTYYTTAQKFHGVSMSIYSCHIQKALIVETLKPLGDHQSPKQNQDVLKLSVTSSKIIKLPNLLSIFSCLKILCLNYCGFESLPAMMIGLTNKLVILNLDNNNIKTLELCFKGRFAKLETLSARSNKITNITCPQPGTKASFRELLLTGNANYDCNFTIAHGERSDTFLNRILQSDPSKQKKQEEVPKITVPDPAAHSSKINALLLQNGTLSDFVIKCKKKQFKVHKSILAVNSSVFEAMLLHKLEEAKSNQLIIKDFNEATVEEFLTFIYTGKVPQNNSNLMDLFAIAALYDVKELKKYCGQEIFPNITEVNALDVLAMGNLYEDVNLKKNAFEKLKEFLKEPQLNAAFMNKPEELNKLVDAKRIYDNIVNEVNMSVDENESK